MARLRLTCLDTSDACRTRRSPTSVISTLLASVVLGALVVVPNPAAAQWQPDRFQVFCGSPFPFSLSSYWLNVAREFGWDTRHAKHYLNYVESLGTELDDPAPGCIDDDRLAEMADMARHALLQIKGVGAAQGRQFTDPSPARLGPIVLDENGERVVRIYADPDHEGIGSTDVRPRSGGGVEPWSVAHVRFSVDHLATQPAWSRYRTIAHELVHVVQTAQQYRTDERAGTPDTLYLWIGEGTADALAAEFTERRGYNARPPLSVRGSRSLYGLRPYNRNLTRASGASDRDEYGNALVTEYTASSFFRYLADRFYDGSFRYLIDWFAVPDKHQGRDDWLEWTDDLLRWDAGGVDHPLYLVFPDFIAHYAGWGERKYSHIGDETWMREAFGGCHTVTLSPSDLVTRLSLELEPLSAVCVKVLVGGVNPDEAISVQWMAYDQDTNRLDNLHLTAARVSNTVGGGTFDCYEEAQKGGPNTLCLHKPFVGARGGRELSPSDGAGVTASGSGFAKTWLGIEQIPSGGDPIENVYFLVHTPVRPRDATHGDANNPERQSVEVDIGMERHKITVATGPTTASASVNGPAGLGLVPMRGGGSASSPDDPLGLMGSITSVMDMATDPDAMSQGLFLQNMPMGTTLPTMEGACDGICMVMVDQKEVRPDGYGGHELATVSAISLGLEEPVPFGATGTFKAMVTGCDQEDCERGIGMGAGQVTVMRYDDQVLHLTASGEYCVIRGLASLTCSDRRTFNAEVLKPFGWAYDGGRTFTSIDTPGMAEYREYTTKALAEVMPGVVTVWRTAEHPRPGEDAPAPGEDGQGGGGGGGGGVVAPACDCTCEGYDALMAAVDEYQAALKAANDEGRPPPPTPPAMQTVMRCTMQCARQWGACGR
jgi:hypothetical protein